MHIHNMVGAESVKQVKDELEKIGVDYVDVTPGRVVLRKAPEARLTEMLSENLAKRGYQLHRRKKMILCEKISKVIVEMVQDQTGPERYNFSKLLHNKLGYHYAYLSSTFSEIRGMTIKEYLIQYKLQKVKELIIQDDLSLTEISYRLKYSSVAHLSAQFKKFTGLTPSLFRNRVRRK